MSKGLLFYRCMLCQHPVSTWDIRDGGCPKCKGRKIVPTNLTLLEKIKQIIKHPKVWTWNDLHTNG